LKYRYYQEIDLAIKARRYLSTWLQWTLRPNSAFRDEVLKLMKQIEENLSERNNYGIAAVVGDETMPKESCCGFLSLRTPAGPQGVDLSPPDRNA
jgi:hypothetical protein